MRTRRKRAEFHQPTLVPLADMLCNTLGIVIFILVFTVLTSGAAVRYEVLPIERPAAGMDDLDVICVGNRVCPMMPAVMDDFTKTASRNDRDAVMHWKYADNYCQAHFESDELCIRVDPKLDSGDAPADTAESNSALMKLLKHESPVAKFVYFIVYPDGLDAFSAARDAARKMGFKTGWSPHGAGNPFRIGFGGGGIRPGIQ